MPSKQQAKNFVSNSYFATFYRSICYFMWDFFPCAHLWRLYYL